MPVIATLTVAVVSAPSAEAADSLPLPGYGDMVVDQAHGRVFVSGGPSSNGVVVADFFGHVLRTISSQSGATGLVLSEDGESLFVALAAGDAISVIDTVSLTETARYSTGAQTCPTHLARTGTLVWFGYGCDDTWNGRIGRLDTTATPPVVLDRQGDTRFQGAPFVTATGAADSPVVAAQLSLSLSALRVFSVSEGNLVPGAAGEVVGSDLIDLSLSPDGATVHTASGSRDGVDAFATADLSRRGVYSTGRYPDSVAVSPDGRYVAAGAYTSGDDAISIYTVGGAAPVTRLDLDGFVLANRGLAWSPTASRLFAVVHDPADARPRLAVAISPVD